jgi:WD40 repeat protein
MYGTPAEKIVADPPLDAKARPLGGSGHGHSSTSGEPDTVLARWWDAETGNELDALKPSFLKNQGPEPADVAFSADGQLVAIAVDNTVVLWHPGHFERKIDSEKASVTSMSFSPDGGLLAVGRSDRTVQLWDVKAQREKLRLRGPTAAVRGVRFDHSGNRVLAWSDDSSIRIWLVRNGELLASLRGHREKPKAVFTPDDRRVISVGDGTVRIWSLEPPPPPETIVSVRNSNADVSYSVDGKHLLLVDRYQGASLLDSATGRVVRALFDRNQKYSR